MQRWFLNLLRVVKPDAQGQAHIYGRKIYILPTKYGFLFAALLMMLLIGAINYANNPAFLLTFLLASLFILTIFQTWRNLLNLELRWLGAEAVFAGEEAQLKLQVSDPYTHQHHAVQVANDPAKPIIQDVLGVADSIYLIPITVTQRGFFYPGRFTVETRFPLGLLRAWSYVEINAEVLVYPKPTAFNQLNPSKDYTGAMSGDKGYGTDDFVGHRNYHPGDHPRHINWKAFASDKGLMIKQFGGDRVDQLWLDFAALTENNTETRLSILTAGVLEMSQQQVQYGLRLPDQEIKPASGQAHMQHCLRALALYGLD